MYFGGSGAGDYRSSSDSGGVGDCMIMMRDLMKGTVGLHQGREGSHLCRGHW